ncbi:MAG: LPD1 domain-containing protein [Blastocatellia bacterium]
MPQSTTSNRATSRGFLQSLKAKRARRVTPMMVAQEAARQGLDPTLAVSVAQQESRGYDATSRVGARGPMQLMPDTGKAIGRRLGEEYNPDDLEQNVRFGVSELKRLSDKYGGDAEKIAKGYNWGEGNVNKSAMPKETRGWLDGVTKTQAELTARLQEMADQMGASQPTNAAPSLSPGTSTTRPRQVTSAPTATPVPQEPLQPTPAPTPMTENYQGTATEPVIPNKTEQQIKLDDPIASTPLLPAYTENDHPPEIVKTVGEAVDRLRNPEKDKISKFQRDAQIGAQPTSGQVMRGTDPTRQDTRLALDAAAIRDAKDVQSAVMDQTANQLGIKPEDYRQMVKLGILDQTNYTTAQTAQIKESAKYYASVAGDKKLYLPISEAQRKVVDAFKQGGWDAAITARGEMDRQSQAYVDSQHEVTPEERSDIETARRRAGRDAEIGKAVTGELNLARGITNAVGFESASNYLKSLTSPIEQQIAAAKPTLDLRTDSQKIAQGLIFGAPIAALRMIATGAAAAPLGIAGEAGAMGVQGYLQNPDAKPGERMKEAVTMAALPGVSKAAAPLISTLAGTGTTAALKEGLGKASSEAAFNVAQEYISNPNAEKTDLIRAGILGAAFSARDVLAGVSSAIVGRQVSHGHVPVESAPDIYRAILSNPEFLQASDAVDQSRAVIADLQAKQAKNQQQIQAGYMPPYQNIETQLQQATAAHEQAITHFEAVIKPMIEQDAQLAPKAKATTAAEEPPQEVSAPTSAEAAPKTTSATASEEDVLSRFSSLAKTGKEPAKLSLDEQKARFFEHPEAEALFAKLGDDINTPKGAKEVDTLIQRLKKSEGFNDLVAEDVTSEFLTPEQAKAEAADAKTKAEARKQADLKNQAKAIQKTKQAGEPAITVPATETYEAQGQRLSKWLDEQNNPASPPQADEPKDTSDLKLDTDLRAKLKNPRWKPFNLESGGRDASRIAASDINLPSKAKPTFPTESVATRATVPLEKIWLGEKSLSREKLLAATENLKNGFRELSDDPVILARNPKSSESFIVLSGGHRIAALKLMDFNGDLPVILREPKAEAKSAGSLFGEGITRDPEYIAQQQRANKKESDARWQQRAEETANRKPSDQERRENVSPIALIRRELGTINPGILMGEGKHLREGGIHGLLSKKAKASINDARELLRDSGYRMPDGRSFDDAFDDEVLSFLEDHGTTARPETMADFNNEKKLADEEEAYYRNKEEQSNADRMGQISDRRDHAKEPIQHPGKNENPENGAGTSDNAGTQQKAPGNNHNPRPADNESSRAELERITTAETETSEPDTEALKRSAPTDAEIEAMARASEPPKPEEGPQHFLPEPKAEAEPTPTIDETDLAERRYLQELMAAREARIGDRKENVGEFGKLRSLAEKSFTSETGETLHPLAQHPEWVEHLDITPDATPQQVLDAIAQDLVNDPNVIRASQMSPAHWRQVLSTKAGNWSENLKETVAATLAGSDLFNQRKDQFLTDEKVQQLLDAPIPPRGMAARVRDLQKLAEAYNGKQDEPTNITKHWIEQTLRQRSVAESRTASDEGRTDAPNEQRAENRTQTRETDGRAEPPAQGNFFEAAGHNTRNSGSDAERSEPQPDIKRDQQSAEQVAAPASLSEQINEAAREAATSPHNDLPEPTDAQKEAGNYRKAHIELHGLDISIENPAGSVRSGVGSDGQPWSVTMENHYGYIRSIDGEFGIKGADKEHLDVYIGNHPESQTVFVVDQIDAQTGKFDEHKVILGATDRASAEKLYDAHFDDGRGPNRRGAITEMEMPVFKDWLKNGNPSAALRYKESRTPENAPLVKPENPLPAKQFSPEEARTKIAALEVQLATAKTEMKKAALRDDIAKLRKLLPAQELEAKQDASESLPEDIAPKPAAPMGIVIEDFGEKIGGARKDTARPLGRRANAKEVDSRPVWLRKYRVAEISKGYQQGKFEIIRDSEGTQQFFATREAAEKAIPLYEAARKHSIHNIAKRGEEANYAIYRKIAVGKYPVVREGFKTADEAKAYLAIHPEEIIEHKFQEPQRPWLDSITRIGDERRAGDVEPKQFQNDFGFRGGEFGNWNKGGDGQAALNYAYDAMHDLAEVLGLPPKALSLGGQLSIAFGARGHGGKDAASAHYEPARAVINLTKIKGAGTFAHEWFHGVDHYTAQLDGKTAAERQPDGTFKLNKSDNLATHGFSWKTKAQRELVDAFKDLVQTMTRRRVERPADVSETQKVADRQAKYVQEALDDIRRNFLYDASRYNKRFKAATPEQLQKFDELSARIVAGEVGEKVYVKSERSRFGGYETYPTIQELDGLFKAVQGRGILRADHDALGRVLGARIDVMVQARARVGQAAQGQGDIKTIGTEFYDNARELDKSRVSDYFSTPHEMGARAFESYIYDKLRAQEKRSDYLVYGVENKYYDGKPYPEGAERELINAAFDRFFETARKLNEESGYLSKAAAEARQRLQDWLQGKQLNDLTQVVTDLTTIAAHHVYEGGKTFGKWATEQIKEFGAKVRPYLRKAWNDAQNKLASLTNPDYAEKQGEFAYERRTDAEPKADRLSRDILQEFRASDDGELSSATGDLGLRELRDRRPLRGRIGGSGVRTTGLAITDQLAQTGRVDLRGQTVESAHDVARLAQIYRDPRIETFRIFYTKDGQIIAHEGTTSRLPNSSRPFATENDARGFAEMKQRMQRLGADGYYLLHNHPSGRPHASPEDLRGTLAFAKKVEGFQGHIIINSGEYAVIEPALTKPQIYQIPDHQETLLTPSIPHDLLNQTIAKPIDAVRLGKQLQAKEGFVTLTYLGSDNRVRAIQEMPESLFQREQEAADYMRGRKRAFGATRIISHAESNPLLLEPARALIQSGALYDHLDQYGRSERPAGMKDIRVPGKGIRVAEASPTETPSTPVPTAFQEEEYLRTYAKTAIKAIKAKNFDPAMETKAMDGLDAVARAIYDNDGPALFAARRSLSEMLTDERPSLKTTKGLKALGNEIVNLPRTIKASIDFSAPLRQGVIQSLNILNLSPRRMREQITNWQKMFTSMGNDAYLNFEAELAAHPRAQLADQTGLYRATAAELDFDSRLTGREEQYLSRIAGNIPIIKHSERAYKAFLDMQRMQSFDRLAGELEAQEHATDFPSFEAWRKENASNLKERHPEKLREQYEAEKKVALRPYMEMADFINKATGRGTLPEFMESAAPIINGLLFSPRYLASRFQLLDPRNYVNAIPGVDISSTSFYSKPVARQAAKEMAGYVAALGIVAGLAAGAGANISLSPDDADFLKMRWGKYRYDLMGGFQQDIRFLWKIGQSFHNDRKDALDVTKHFLRSKLAPLPGYAVDAWTGKDFTGKKFSFGRDTASLVAPLLLQDLYSGFKDEGLAGAAKMLPGVFGVGVQAYDSKKTTTTIADQSLSLPKREKTASGKEEPDALYQKRVQRAEQWFEQYGKSLFESARFRTADEATQKRVKQLFHQRVTEQSKLKDPDTGKLTATAIWEAVQKSKERKADRSDYLWPQ